MPEKFRISEEDYYMILKKENKYFYYEKNREDYACESLRFTVGIRHNGDIIPCPRFFMPIGNINNDRLDETWEKLSRIHNIKWKDIDVCMGCEYKDFCKRCPGLVFDENGNVMYKSLINCFLAKINKRIYLENELL